MRIPGITPELSGWAYKLTKILEKNNIQHAVIGGIAVGRHAKPRATQDVDVIVNRRDIDKILELFPNHSPLYIDGREGYKIDINQDGVEDFDVLIAEDEESFLLNDILDYHGVKVLSAYNLIYTKLNGRTKDSNDIVQILQHLSPDEREGFVPYMNSYIGLSEDMIEEYNGWKQIAELEALGNFRKARASFRAMLTKK